MPALAAMGQLPSAVVNFGREFAREAAACQAAYAAATNRIPAKYTRDLEALRAKFQEAGDLDSLLAVKNEIARYKKAKSEEADPFETVPEMTAEVIVAAPAELRQLQEQYVASFTDAAAALRKGVAERGERYRAQIKAAQAALTRAGKIDEAIAVRNEGERVAKILDSGDISELVGNADAATPQRPQADSAKPDTPRTGGRPQPTSPIKWTYRNHYPFSRDLPKYFAPDVPNEMSAFYTPSKANGSFLGRCSVAAAQVGDVLCSWNGRALLWDVPGADALAMDIRIKSTTLSGSADRGPHVELAVLANGVKVKSLSVPVCKAEDVVKIVRNASNANLFALYWPLGSKSETFEVPAGARLNVLFGAVLHNPGEECDLSFQLEEAGAKR